MSTGGNYGGSSRSTWWDQPLPQTNSGSQDWAQYYQSLEAYHSQSYSSQQQQPPPPQSHHQQQQQQIPGQQYQDMYSNYGSANPSTEYQHQQQQHYQNYHGQQQYQQSAAGLYTGNGMQVNGYPSQTFVAPTPDINSTNTSFSALTGPASVAPNLDSNINGLGTSSSRSSSITRGATQGMSNMSIFDSGDKSWSGHVAQEGSWRTGSTDRLPAYTSVQPPKKAKIPAAASNISKTAASKIQKTKPIQISKSKGTSERDWPESLKDFVERSFKQCSPRAVPFLEKQLQQIIASATSNKKLYTIDWNTRPLPKACSMTVNPPGSKAAHAAKKTPASAPVLPKNTFEDFDSVERKERRLRRFQQEAEAEAAKKRASENATLKISPTHHINDVHDWDADTIVGTCSRLEKSYLRLTSAPDPSQVRPLPVLRQTLELLKRKWIRESNYAYICDQFKSMRQDLTVQRITNNFTVEVYELHARIALETNDLGEYNQCQTQLKQLYSMGLSGHSMEFLAYRILYFLYTRNKADIIAALAAMTPEERQDPAVQHALSVRKAVATGDYHSFFKLYIAAPNMAGYLMDNFADRERCLALQKMCKAFRPKLKLATIASELAFEDIEACVKFLTNLNIATTSEGEHLEAIDMKTAYPHAVAAMQKYNVVDIKGQI